MTCAHPPRASRAKRVREGSAAFPAGIGRPWQREKDDNGRKPFPDGIVRGMPLRRKGKPNGGNRGRPAAKRRS
ncbi:MAG: hypothetical protein IK082_08400 [Oscillospiraceae bacterium]|nr:hypothetical protein [Oscillospiraceae bacterium]